MSRPLQARRYDRRRCSATGRAKRHEHVGTRRCRGRRDERLASRIQRRTRRQDQHQRSMPQTPPRAGRAVADRRRPRSARSPAARASSARRRATASESAPLPVSTTTQRGSPSRPWSSTSTSDSATGASIDGTVASRLDERRSLPLPDPRRAPLRRRSSDRAEVESCPLPCNLEPAPFFGRSRSRPRKVRNFFGIELSSNAEISHRG